MKMNKWMDDHSLLLKSYTSILKNHQINHISDNSHDMINAGLKLLAELHRVTSSTLIIPLWGYYSMWRTLCTKKSVSSGAVNV